MAGMLDNLRQTLILAAQNDIQVILVHDVADLETSRQLNAMIKEIQQLNFHLIEDVFGNPGDARNAGLQFASREWFAFWDSDDLPNVREFSLMVERASAARADIAIGGIETCYFGSESTRRTFPAFPIESRNSIFQLAQMPAFTRMAFRNFDAEKMIFPPLSMGEDVVFLARSRFLERTIYIHSKSVYLYILNFPGQLTSSSSKLNQVSEIWDYLYKESEITAGMMQRYINFQMIRNQMVTMKQFRSLPIKVIKLSLLRLIKNPVLTTASYLHILKNQNLLERRAKN
jgi:glycosyltransferase involved in cell wall biosynthesis